MDFDNLNNGLNKKKEENMKIEDVCPDCNGTGRVVKNGSVSVCIRCLLSGKMDQHTTKIKDAKDFGVKI